MYWANSKEEAEKRFKNIDNYIAKMTLAFLPLIWILNYHTS